MPDGSGVFERFLEEMTRLVEALSERLDTVERASTEDERVSPLHDAVRLAHAVIDLATAFEVADFVLLGEAISQAATVRISAGAPLPVAILGARDTLSYLRWRLGEMRRAGAALAFDQRALSMAQGLVTALSGGVVGPDELNAGAFVDDDSLSELSPDEREMIRSFATTELRPRDEGLDARSVERVSEARALELEQSADMYSEENDGEQIIETKQVFILETEDDLHELTALIASYGREPEEARAQLIAMAHIAHKIKGTAATIGFPEVSRLASYLEEWARFALRHTGAVSEDVIKVTLGRFLELFDAGLAAAAALEPPDPGIVEDAERLYEVAIQWADSPTFPPDAIAASPTTGTTMRRGSPRPAAARQTIGREPLLQVDSARLDALMIQLSALAMNRGSLAAAHTRVSQAQRDLRATLDRLHEKSAQIVNSYPLTSKALSLAGDLQHESDQGGEQPFQATRSAISGQLRASWNNTEFEGLAEVDSALRALTEAVTDMETLNATLSGALMQLGQIIETQKIIVTDIQQDATRMRLAPLAELAPRLEIMARFLASKLGKRVRFAIEGEMTEIDRALMRSLAEPLNQIVRNAITHGIETPEERIEVGKPEIGSVWIHAYYAGSEVVIEVGDDGRGVNTHALIGRAISNDALDVDKARTLSSEAALQLMFQPGLTTMDYAGALAGSGIGLSEVATLIRDFKGEITVVHTSDQGTLFRIRAPMTLTMLPILEISVADQLYTVPFNSVVASFEDVRGNLRLIPRDQEQPSDERKNGAHAPIAYRFTLPDETGARLTAEARAGVPLLPGAEIPAFSLAECLGFVSDEPPGAALVVERRQGHFALLVDAFGATRETMVRPLPSYLNRALLRGVTIRSDDGAMALLIEVGELVDQLLAGAIMPSQLAPRRVARARPVARVLIVDDSVTIRRALDQMLSGAGFSTVLASDGYEALEMMEAETPRVVILDVEMPRLNGNELLEIMRSSPKYAQTRVVMLTSQAGPQHERRARELGADEYFVKPCPEDTLISAVRRLLADSEPS